MLLNILGCTGQPSMTKNFPAQNVHSAEVEKSCYTRNNLKSAFLAGSTYIWQFQLFNVCIHLFMYFQNSFSMIFTEKVDVEF